MFLLASIQVRLFKFLNHFRETRVIFRGMVAGVRATGAIMTLLVILMYLYAIIGCRVFRHNDPMRFGRVVRRGGIFRDDFRSAGIELEETKTVLVMIVCGVCSRVVLSSSTERRRGRRTRFPAGPSSRR